MKLRYTDGCTCTSLQVDGKEFNLELSLDERRNIARKILEVTTSPEVSNMVRSPHFCYI